jgi:hypothetical protein
LVDLQNNKQACAGSLVPIPHSGFSRASDAFISSSTALTTIEFIAFSCLTTSGSETPAAGALLSFSLSEILRDRRWRLP